MGLTKGARLGPYEIVAQVGAGGMGEVYRARDTRLDRTVAVKILPPALATDPAFRDRFAREARTISALDHPHICALHDVGEQDGIAFLVMPFLDGETLADRLRRGALPVDEATTIAEHIAAALEAAHERGIVHRDLKPGNIIVSRDGAAKVLDFGLAKDLAPASPDLSMSPTVLPSATRAGMIVGTVAYMAPEQARGAQVDKRADIWAFGCVLYEMLAGRAAFTGGTAADILAAVVAGEPDMTALPAGVPSNVRRLLQRCLQKDPRRRLRDIGDARLELEADGAAAAPVPSPPLAARFGWIVAAVLGLAVIALAVARLRGPAALPPAAVTRLEITTPPTVDPASFAISPDGRTLAGVATVDGRTRLWLRPLDQTTAQPIAGTDGATQPFWSPDGRSIAFFADDKLKRIDRGGGTAQVLADAPFPRGGTWSREGVIVFSPNTPGGLMRVPAGGGAVSEATHAQSVSHRWPHFLDDGRRFLFYLTIGPTETRGEYLGSLDGGEPVPIARAEAAGAFAPPDRFLVVQQGVLVAMRLDLARGAVIGTPTPIAHGVGVDTNRVRGVFSVSKTGVLVYRGDVTTRRQLLWVDRAGRTVGGVGGPDEFAASSPSVAPDGRRVVLQRFVQGNVDVWMLDVARGVPTRLTFDPGVDGSPVWSPDGRRIAFEGTRAGSSTLLSKPASGTGGEESLLATPEAKIITDWSRDGRFLLFDTASAKTASDLWALPLDGDRKPISILATPFDEVGGQLSPDGRWIAYASNASGRYEIYVRPFLSTGDEVQVSAAGGTQPRWRHDGKELFYASLDGRLMAVPMSSAPGARTIEAGVPVALFPIRLATGPNVYPGQAQYAVADDGRFLVNVGIDEPSATPVAIVLNWDAVLEK